MNESIEWVTLDCPVCGYNVSVEVWDWDEVPGSGEPCAILQAPDRHVLDAETAGFDPDDLPSCLTGYTPDERVGLESRGGEAALRGETWTERRMAGVA